jgi:F420H(2)-dependent quinone reductase
LTATTLWLISVHGRQANFVKNLVKQPDVRVKHRGRWCTGRASVEPLDPQRVKQFNLYARMGPTTLGIEPVLVRVELG